LKRAFLAVAILLATAAPTPAEDAAPAAAEDSSKAAVNIEEGDRIYNTRCVLCHGKAGGRGPNLFATSLSEEQFVEIAINGRKGTQMPAFGYVLSPDDIADVYAFVKSRESAF
jgi:mono/diheme cytochrome c family protein